MDRRLFLAGLALAPFGCVQSRPPGTRPAASMPPTEAAKREGPGVSYFPNFVLRTHENRPVRFYDDLIAGKIVVINMMYAQCDGICPGVTSNLMRVREALKGRVGRDIFMYSLTLQPEQDSPDALRHYVEMHGIAPGWDFLTGERSEMEVLRRKLGFVNPDPAADADRAQHTGLIRYGNETLDRWAACPALANPEQIVNAIQSMDTWKTKQARVAAAGAGKPVEEVWDAGTAVTAL